MNTLTHKIEEMLLKEALGNEDSSQWATNKMEKNKMLLSEREEKEKNDTPEENEGKLIPQIGLSKYEQPTGLKRRRGTTAIMVADGEDVDHLEAAYEALATRKTISVELENSTITLNMGNKEDKAKRDMLTHKENEVQDNIKVITENRNQFKTIGYKGFVHDTMNKYRQETNDYLATHGGTSTDGVTGIEHHTTNTSTGDMEIYIITATNPRDRDLILGYISGTIRLRYTEETARGPNLKFGRQGFLHVGQLDKGGTRVSFRAKGSNTGLNTNPIYMKAWAEAANELKEQGKGAILDGFWPQIDSQEGHQQTQPLQEKKRKEESTRTGCRSGRTRYMDDPNSSEIKRRTR
jgi:hypothetical protein